MNNFQIRYLKLINHNSNTNYKNSLLEKMKIHILKTNKNLIVLAFLSFIIFVCRIISFRENSLDPDELEYLYAIRRCLIDPRPFVGFDSHTTGPMAIYLLALIKMLTGFSKLYQLRLITYFCFILPSLYFIYDAIKPGAKIIGATAFTVLVCISNFPSFGPYYDGIFCYNTEYQLLFYTSLLYWIIQQKPNKMRLIGIALLIFILPMVKFQAIPITLFFAIYIGLKFILAKEYEYLKFTVFAYAVFISIGLFYLVSNGLMEDFSYFYLTKNLSYMSSNALGQSSINPINFIHRVNQFYSFLYIFLLLFLYHLIKVLPKNKFFFRSFFLHPLTFSFSFLVISTITIVISKNDFGHYYIFLFLPTSIFIAELYHALNDHSESRNHIYALFMIILFVNFNFSFFGKSCELVWNKMNAKSVDHLTFGKPLNSIIEKELVDWLENHRQSKQEAILSIGWTQSQALYYQLQDDFKPMYSKSNFFYYKNSFETKNTLIFKKEETILIKALASEKPLFIVDTWNLLNELKGTQLLQFVANHYDLRLTLNKNKVYQRRSN